MVTKYFQLGVSPLYINMDLRHRASNYTVLFYLSAMFERI